MFAGRCNGSTLVVGSVNEEVDNGLAWKPTSNN